jgi:glycosyltransferase involved in cell wall biosynthesis
MIVARGIEQSVLCRDLDGFFTHVWSVHPFASHLTSDTWAEKNGKPIIYEINEKHTFIEGRVGRFKFLNTFPTFNFLISQLFLFINLFFIIKRNNVKIIRVGDPLYLGMFGYALSFLTRAKLVIRVNGNNSRVRLNTGKALYPKLFKSIQLEDKIERFIFPRTHLVVAPNQDNLEYAIASGTKPERVRIFRYGNLLAPIHLEEPSNKICNQFLFTSIGITPRNYILLVGRLLPVKYPEDSIIILAQVLKTKPTIKLVLVGEGEMKDELVQLCENLNILSNVIFLGNQDQSVLSQLYTFAGVVLSPLTGRALSEAALCGSPVVAYDLDWQGEIILHEKTGFLIPFRDVEKMATYVVYFLDHLDFSINIGKNLREHALSILDPKILDEYEREEYTKLLSS